MKKINLMIGIVMFLSMLVNVGFSQGNQCDDFSSFPQGGWSAIDTTTVLPSLINGTVNCSLHDYFAGANNGGYGGYDSNLYSFGYCGVMKYEFSDNGNKKIVFGNTLYGGAVTGVSVNGGVYAVIPYNTLDTVINGISMSYDSSSQEYVFEGEIETLELESCQARWASICVEELPEEPVQQTCDDFSSFPQGGWHAADTSTVFPSLINGTVNASLNNYFASGQGGYGGYNISSQDFGWSYCGVMKYEFLDNGNKKIVFGNTLYGGAVTGVSVNGGVYAVIPYNTFDTVIGGISMSYDTIAQEYIFEGEIETLELESCQTTWTSICVEELPEEPVQQTCDDFSSFPYGWVDGIDTTTVLPSLINGTVNCSLHDYFVGGNNGGYGGYDPDAMTGSGSGLHYCGVMKYEFLDNGNKKIVFGNMLYGGAVTGVSVNGGVYAVIPNILDTVINGVSMSYDSSTQEYIFEGEIETLELESCQARWASICVEKLIEECTDYVTVSEPEGIYIFGDTTFSFNGANQTVSMEVYGLFNNWDLSANHQANQTYFTVNGGASVSLEDIYNNQPYILNGTSITVDTATLAFNSIGGNWTTGTIIFSGDINTITMTQFESGLLKICKTINSDCNCEHEDCPCNISADFTYTSNSHNYYFTSAATGTEYEWSFGDGESSTIADPFHNYETAGTYEVCLTNYNLTDTCSITVCDLIIVTCTTPNANIITPNQDGIDDFIYLQCGDVKVYNRNGGLVIELVNQSIWGGNDSNGSLVPMGEYILVCQSTGITTSVSVIW